jgi:glutamine synthetase
VQAAGLDGVRRGLDPGAALSGHDMGAVSAAERERLGAPELPRTLDQALDAFEADAVIREALGPTLAEAFLVAKRSEARSHAASVSEWEYAHYLEHF